MITKGHPANIDRRPLPVVEGGKHTGQADTGTASHG